MRERFSNLRQVVLLPEDFHLLAQCHARHTNGGVGRVSDPFGFLPSLKSYLCFQSPLCSKSWAAL